MSKGSENDLGKVIKTILLAKQRCRNTEVQKHLTVALQAAELAQQQETYDTAVGVDEFAGVR